MDRRTDPKLGNELLEWLGVDPEKACFPAPKGSRDRRDRKDEIPDADWGVLDVVGEGLAVAIELLTEGRRSGGAKFNWGKERELGNVLRVGRGATTGMYEGG